MGTWIEILRHRAASAPAAVVPYVGTWIEISLLTSNSVASNGRSLRGNVDRNMFDGDATAGYKGRSLRGNVDRNGIGKVLSGKIICSNC